MDTEEESCSSDVEDDNEELDKKLSSSFKQSQKTPIVQEELLEEELELMDRPDTEISHWWKTLTLISYFVTIVSGLASSIAIGDLLAAFGNRCILYAKVSLINMDQFNGESLLEINISQDNWGNLYDCEFCEFASVFSVVFAGMLFAMFLQCGRGGITSKGRRRSWEFLPLAILITAIFFIIATVIFAKTIGGLSFFCDYIVRDSHSPGNITSCPQILSYQFPFDEYRTDLYVKYILAHIGSTLTFVGWMSSLAILIFRCLFGVDFILYRKTTLATMNEENVKDQSQAQKGGQRKKVQFLMGSNDSLNNLSKKYDSLSTGSSSEEMSDSGETTAFITVDVTVETKKLI